MKIQEKNLRDALNRFFYEMRDRLAKKESEGYTGWDGAYPRAKLIAEIKRDVKLCEDGKATQKTALDIANRIFMCWYDFPMNGTKKKAGAN